MKGWDKCGRRWGVRVRVKARVSGSDGVRVRVALGVRARASVSMGARVRLQG